MRSDCAGDENESATVSRLAKKAIDAGKIEKVRREYRLIEDKKKVKKETKK